MAREHEWMSLAEAGRYANLSTDVLRGAIIAGELVAYEKPVTKGRRDGARHYAQLRIKRTDVDDYIRGTWRRAGAHTFGVPEMEVAS